MIKKITTTVLLIVIILTIYLERDNIFSINKKNLETPINSVTYLCNNNKKIDADFYKGKEISEQKPDQPPTPTGYVNLNLNNEKTMTLNQTISADGGRYANSDESFVFWDKGNGAMILENDKENNFIGCILSAKNPSDQNLPQTYLNSKNSFTIRLPEKYSIDESYEYKMSPEKTFAGVKFTIPKTESDGTNLGSDSYISIEKISEAKECTAKYFLDDPSVVAKNITENNSDYSFATSTGAGAGNRYEETVYAMPFKSDCVAVRYFIHYSVFENYPTGTIKEFDKQKLINEFGAIRKTLVLN